MMDEYTRNSLIEISDKLYLIFEKKLRVREVEIEAMKLKREFKKLLNSRLKRFFAMLKSKTSKTDPWWLEWHRDSKAAALTRQIATADWILTHAVETETEEYLVVQLLKPYYEAAGRKGADRAVKTLSGYYGRRIYYKGATSWIQDNAIVWGRKYSQIISKTTNKMIRSKLALGIEKGHDLNKVIGNIKGLVMGPNNLYRAEMVGRTEMNRAYNISRLYQDSAFGITQYGWTGCDMSDQGDDFCQDAVANGPYTAAEIEWIIMNTHPNCVGGQVPIIPQGFVPDENSAGFGYEPAQTIRPGYERARR